VRIVSPASALLPEQAERGLGLLRGWGLEPVLGDNVYASDGHLAGSDALRAADLAAAFSDRDAAAVFCSRGGYGCARLIERVDFDAAAASGKMLCGFSDVTSLHLALRRRGLATMHAPMLITLSVEREPWVEESLRRILFGEDPLAVEYPSARTLRGGSAEGEISGGCLCLLTDSLGTPDEWQTDGRILIIEDVDEAPHRVDAMLTALRNAGKLQRAAGIVIGEMTRTDERADEGIGGWPWERIVEDRLADLDIPAIIGFPFGHMKNMLSLPLGIRARLDADAGRLELLESPCAD
jgi:muramoyltetrapeptide carboxypeptidase